MIISEAYADAKTIILTIGLLCGFLAPVFGSIVLLLLARLKAGAEATLAPGVTPMMWPMWLAMVSLYALAATGPLAALLGAAGAGLVFGLRRLGATPVVVALACALLGAIAGVLCISVPLAVSSLGLGRQQAVAAIRPAWLDPGNPYTVAAAVTGMVFGLGIWIVVGRQRRR